MSEPKPQAPAPQQQVVPVPQVDIAQAKGFAKVWKKNGLTIILDETAIEFARDFANVVLKSLVMDGLKRAAMAQAATQKPRVPPSVPQKNLVSLT